MSDGRDWALTGGLLAAAALAVGAAWATTPRPPDTSVYAEEGKPLLPDLTDPHASASIEIVGWDEAASAARPFKVERKGNRWIIPSHEDYPAEAEDRLVKVSGALVTLRRDKLVAERETEHATLGVVDPLDAKATGGGRGTHVTLRDASGRVLADAVVGKAVEGDDGWRYVRVVGETRTWAVKMKGVDLSAEFHDWIERDLLKADRWTLRRIEMHPYRIDEQTMRILPAAPVVLSKPDTGDWGLDGMTAEEQLNREKLDGLVGALDDLKIVDVRRKPEGLSQDLKRAAGIQIPDLTRIDLQNKGFFFTPDGALVSNEGELLAWSHNGVRYILRFGELAGAGEGKTEGRYLFITAAFDAEFLPEPKKPEPPAAPPGTGDGAPSGNGAKPPGDGATPPGDGEKPPTPPTPPGGDAPPGGGGQDAIPGDVQDPENPVEKPQDPPAAGPQDPPAPAPQEPPTGTPPPVPAPDAAKPAEPVKPVEPPKVDDAEQKEWERKHEEWRKKRDEGQKQAAELNARFADWYYVIPGDEFKKIRLARADLVKAKDGK